MDYTCTRCGASPGRDLLTVKKVHFLEIGVGGKTRKTRTVDWLCPLCTSRDPDWKREAYDAPGMKPHRESAGLTPDNPYGSVTVGTEEVLDAS